MTPVILLSDNYIANGAEPWQLPEMEDLKPFKVNFATDPRGLPALHARREAGPRLGQARDAGPGAPHRRSREGRRHRQRQLRPGEPPAHGRDRASRRSWTSATPSPRPRSTARTPGPAGRGLGLDLRGDPRGGRTACRRTARRSATCTCATCGRCPTAWPEIFARLQADHRSRDEPGPAGPAADQRVSRSSSSRILHKVQGKPFQARRAEGPLRRDPGGDSHERRPALKAKDFKSDQEVRWCPGCGDYSILNGVQNTLAEHRRGEGERGHRVGHRLFEPLPLLHGHLRLPRHPRAGQRHRHRRQGGQPRPATSGSSPATATACPSAATT